jgi:SpoIID/LytB domain protein
VIRPLRGRATPLATAVATLAGSLLGAVAVEVGRAAPAGAFPGTTVDLVGQGFGHGRGMGQWGALGYAVKGWTYDKILDHYYGGTKMGTAPGANITVQLTRFDGLDLVVVQEHGHLHTNAGPGTFTALRARKTGANLFTVESGTDCGGTAWQPVGTVAGPVTFTPDDPHTEDRTEMLQVCEPGGTRRWLRGEVDAVVGTDAANTTTSRAVNKVDLEGYVRGVVPRESPASWGTTAGGLGMAALRAQAVAARSYSLAERRSVWAQTCDTQSCQVYGGRAEQDASGFRDLEQPTTDQAVADTARQVRVFTIDGTIARTEFSSSTGGYTAGGVFPAVPDDGDAVDSNPSHTWTAKIPVDVLEAAHPEIGELQSVDVTKRNGLGDMGGRVVEVVLRGDKGKATLAGGDLRGLWPYSSAGRPTGLRSDWFRVVNNPSGGLSGYWVAAPDGGIFTFGEARFFGSVGGQKLNAPILGLAASPTGGGYWLLGADGGIFSFGDAAFFGSTGSMKLNRPIVGMSSRGGDGYWLVASDGGIFSYGSAPFFGSTGSTRLNKPIVGMAQTATGQGYWLVASDGGIFSYGDAGFFGSTGSTRLNKPIVGMAPTPTGKGYWLLAADGGLFSFGDAGFFGSIPGSGAAGPAVAMRPTRTGGGYLIVNAAGAVLNYGDAPALGGVPDFVPNYRGGVAGLDVLAATTVASASARH